MFINPALLPKMQALFPTQPVKPARPNYSASETYKAKQRAQRERTYARRAMRANVAVWSLVIRILRSLLTALWAKVPTAPQPLPADHEWPAAEYLPLAVRWMGKPI